MERPESISLGPVVIDEADLPTFSELATALRHYVQRTWPLDPPRILSLQFYPLDDLIEMSGSWKGLV
jgi:hypothetical protein